MGCLQSKPSPTPTPAASAPKASPLALAEARLTAAGLVRQATYWSDSAKLVPACIVQPRTADEVAKAVQILAATKTRFAVRSGGHTQWAGANNIQGGATLDLGALSWTRLSPDGGETADIGPGGLWSDVYAELHRHGRVVAGGREGNVGVAGLILGGGNTFYTPRRGFACDNVEAFEVVLADGTLVTADQHGSYSDLYWALKGGSNNFGVVTNFRMRTLPGSGPVWGGLTFFPKQLTESAIDALADFTENMHKDPDSNLLCFFAYTVSDLTLPLFKDVGIATMSVQVAGVENAAAYQKWQAMTSIQNTCKLTTIPELVSDPAHNLPRGYRNIWFTATLKNDRRITAKAAELHEGLVEELKSHIPDGDFWTQCLFQPLPVIFGQHSLATGGNALGVDRQEHDGVLFLAAAMLKTAEQEAFAYPRVKAWVRAVQDFAQTIEHGNLGWTYLNYADPSQDPLGSYGKANVQRLREVAANMQHYQSKERRLNSSSHGEQIVPRRSVKPQGICTHCGESPVATGKTKCDDCAKKWKARFRLRRRTRSSNVDSAAQIPDDPIQDEPVQDEHHGNEQELMDSVSKEID
ncbi:hypothetical protein PG985_003904 [Apiospora marii]|uniref:uncharacterized protein n=1 Tax=Apiospora marii TaxID=335849 RepID=UPI00312F151C